MPLDDLPARFADTLESVAARIRAMTADRLERWIRMGLFAAVVVILAIMGLAFFLVAAHRGLAILVGSAGSLGVLGGLFLAVGLLIWNRGNKRSPGDK